MFGRTTPPTADDPAIATELDRLESLPLAQLAAEVLGLAFGTGGPGADDPNTVWDGTRAQVSGGPDRPLGRPAVSVTHVTDALGPTGTEQAVFQRRRRLVAEALQLLEHAGLVRFEETQGAAQGLINYALTRAGRSALETSSVDRVLGG